MLRFEVKSTTLKRASLADTLVAAKAPARAVKLLGVAAGGEIPSGGLFCPPLQRGGEVECFCLHDGMSGCEAKSRVNSNGAGVTTSLVTFGSMERMQARGFKERNAVGGEQRAGGAVPLHDSHVADYIVNLSQYYFPPSGFSGVPNEYAHMSSHQDVEDFFAEIETQQPPASSDGMTSEPLVSQQLSNTYVAPTEPSRQPSNLFMGRLPGDAPNFLYAAAQGDPRGNPAAVTPSDGKDEDGMDVMGGNPRSHHNPNSVLVLKNWFYENLRHPYPSSQEKLMLAQLSGLTLHQVSTWLVNARKRIWRPMKETRDAPT